MTAPEGPPPRRTLAEIDAELWEVGAARVALPVLASPAEIAASYERESRLWREVTDLFWDSRTRAMAGLAAVEADRAEQRAQSFRLLAAATSTGTADAAPDVAGTERVL